MDLLNLLEQLTAASGVSGSENSIAAVAQELLIPYCDTCLLYTSDAADE